MSTKKWYESKTFWLNLIGLIISAFLAPEAGLEFSAEETAAGFSVGNMLLRLGTHARIIK